MPKFFKSQKFSLYLLKNQKNMRKYLLNTCLIVSFLCPLPLFAQSSLQGKTVWTIFDSLGDGTPWQPLLAQLTGSTFFPQLNYHNISYGGTATVADDMNGTQSRAKRLVALKGKYPIDVVLLENVNDINYIDAEKGMAGSMNDQPWMQGDKLTVHEGALSNRQEAETYFQQHLSDFLRKTPLEQRKAGNMLVLPYNDSTDWGTCIAIQSKALKERTFFITSGRNKSGVYVTPDMTEKDIITRMMQYNYGGGWTAVNNGDGTLTLHYYYKQGRNVAFDDNGTGVKATLTKVPRSSECIRYFMGKDASEWEDTSKWVTQVSLYSTYKALFSYLRQQLPNAKLYWVLTSYYNFDFDTPGLQNADSTFNKKAFSKLEVERKWQQLCRFQKKICKENGIEVIDISYKCGINLDNLRDYYHTKNSHPKEEGYAKWAYALARYFKK
jgi:hypothetical protein